MIDDSQDFDLNEIEPSEVDIERLNESIKKDSNVLSELQSELSEFEPMLILRDRLDGATANQSKKIRHTIERILKLPREFGVPMLINLLGHDLDECKRRASEALETLKSDAVNVALIERSSNGETSSLDNEVSRLRQRIAEVREKHDRKLRQRQAGREAKREAESRREKQEMIAFIESRRFLEPTTSSPSDRLTQAEHSILNDCTDHARSRRGSGYGDSRTHSIARSLKNLPTIDSFILDAVIGCGAGDEIFGDQVEAITKKIRVDRDEWVCSFDEGARTLSNRESVFISRGGLTGCDRLNAVQNIAESIDDDQDSAKAQAYFALSCHQLPREEAVRLRDVLKELFFSLSRNSSERYTVLRSIRNLWDVGAKSVLIKISEETENVFSRVAEECAWERQKRDMEHWGSVQPEIVTTEEFSYGLYSFVGGESCLLKRFVWDYCDDLELDDHTWIYDDKGEHRVKMAPDIEDEFVVVSVKISLSESRITTCPKCSTKRALLISDTRDQYDSWYEAHVCRQCDYRERG